METSETPEVTANTPELLAAATEANAKLEAWEDDLTWREWLDSGAGGFI